VTTAAQRTNHARALRHAFYLAVLALSARLPASAGITPAQISQIRKQCRTDDLPTLNVVSAAVVARPKDAELLSCLGKVSGALGHQTAAIGAYQRSLTINPKNVEAWLRLGALRRDALEADPGNRILRLAFIETILHTAPESDLDKEIDEFLRSSSTDERLELTRVLISNNKLNRAQSILVELTKSDPVPAEARAQLGLILMEKEDFENAVMELGQAAQAEPKSSRYSLALSEALLRWHHYSTALAFLQAVKADFGALPQFQYNLAYSYYGMRDVDSAVSILTALLKQKPAYGQAQFLLGNCYVAKGNLELAEKWLRRAVDADKTRLAYYVSLAQVNRYQGRISEALAVVQRALAIDPEDSEAIFESALCHESRGELQVAQGELERLLAKRPGLAKAHRALARVYGRMGNGAAAEAEQQKLAQLENKAGTPEHNTVEDKR
jgi:tetratricopeptide (TPR) repeat protein